MTSRCVASAARVTEVRATSARLVFFWAAHVPSRSPGHILLLVLARTPSSRTGIQLQARGFLLRFLEPLHRQVRRFFKSRQPRSSNSGNLSVGQATKKMQPVPIKSGVLQVHLDRRRRGVKFTTKCRKWAIFLPFRSIRSKHLDRNNKSTIQIFHPKYIHSRLEGKSASTGDPSTKAHTAC